MSTTQLDRSEPARQAALDALRLLDTESEERFDRITRVARHALTAPVSLLTLLDAQRQWAKSVAGEFPRQIPRCDSFCTHTLADTGLMEVPDAHLDPRFAANPLVTGDRHVTFYAGVPLHAPSGAPIGTLCVLDHRARQLTDSDRRTLLDLAGWAELELGMAELGRASAQAQRLRARLQLVLASAAEAICATDREGRVALANPAAEQMSRWEEHELLGRDLVSTLMGQRPDGSSWGADHPLRRALHGGTAQTNLEGTVWCRDGQGVPVVWSVAPLLERGEVTGAVVIFEDVTLRRQAERLKDEFVSVVSHELRTPLTALRGSLGLITGGVLGDIPDQAMRMLHVAQHNTDRLIRLVNDMLDLERLRAGRVELVHARTDLHELLELGVGNVVPLAQAGGVTFTLDCPPVTVWADADRVVQAVTNLLSNAVKYSEPGSSVRVAAEPVEDHVRVRVRDHGRGIPITKIDRIFERFAQVDASDAREKGGTGLGLAITRHIVDSHGGRIWVDSEPGLGSTFTFTLPRGRTDADTTGRQP